MIAKPLTPDERGLSAGFDIYRKRRPSEWLAALAALPDGERPAAERFLREQGARIKSFRAWRERAAAGVKGRATAAAVAGLALALVLLPALASPPWHAPSNVRGTVAVIVDGMKVQVIGPCKLVPGPLVDYAGTQPEVLVALDCTALFRDGFE
jgi:hypothetical protein